MRRGGGGREGDIRGRTRRGEGELNRVASGARAAAWKAEATSDGRTGRAGAGPRGIGRAEIGGGGTGAARGEEVRFGGVRGSDAWLDSRPGDGKLVETYGKETTGVAS